MAMNGMNTAPTETFTIAVRIFQFLLSFTT